MTKEIELTRDLKTVVDDDAYKWLSDFEWFAQKDSRGQLYAATTIMGDTVYLHRLLMDEEDGDLKIDHINGDTLDNRIENLRVTDAQENAMNQRKTKNPKSSQYKGVTHVKSGKWKAHIGLDDRDIHIGYFDTEEEAARAYDERAIELFDDKASLNFPAGD